MAFFNSAVGVLHNRIKSNHKARDKAVIDREEYRNALFSFIHNGNLLSYELNIPRRYHRTDDSGKCDVLFQHATV